MSAAAFTPGPWSSIRTDDDEDFLIQAPDNDPGGQPEVPWCVGVVYDSVGYGDNPKDGLANARLIAAAPELYDGCNALLGLVQLILGRDDLSAELREVLTTNHRIAEAEAATAKARGEQ